ncbi:probable pre-mRNA-splicing factor ATP-dependent RNA helicase DEAH5 [Tanacetum coccineum]
MDHTCFVDILDVKGKARLVHMSRIVTRRVASAKDTVKRDQEVCVKVILVSNKKFSFSIRDVDQNTGKDLLPLNKSGEDGDGGSVNVGSGVDNSNNKSWISLMEYNIDYDGQNRGKREDPSPNPIATDGDRFCKKRKQAVNWEFEGVNDIQFSHKL